MQGDRRQERGRGDRHHPRAGIVAGLIATAVLVFATPAPAATDGEVHLVRNITSAAASQLLAAEKEPARQGFWLERYAAVRGYSPYFDDHTFSGSPAWTPPSSEFYRDLYAIYNNASGEQLIASHPDWVLRDSAGKKLFIQYGCSGGSCPQYAADIGNPEFRANWINQARATMAKGYSGIFVDDVNLTMRVSDGAGTFTRPMDARTGAPMTDADWRRYVAEFSEAIRAAFPSARIVHNVYWRNHATLKNDPYALREVAAADAIEAERGFNDPGLVGGSGTFGYETYLAHMDWLHQRGRSIVFEPYGLGATSAEFELASYYLVKDLDDAIASAFQADPDAWWSGWDADLGTPSGPRYVWNGLLRRDFEKGIALVNQPGAPTRTVQAPGGYTDLAGNAVGSLTLGPRRGQVLLALAGGGDPDPPPGGEDPDPPETSITAGPSGQTSLTAVRFEFSSSKSGSTFACRLDSRQWEACTSPTSYSGLGRGPHAFSVRATDAAGRIDPTPAHREFQITSRVTIKTDAPKLRRGEPIVLSGTANLAASVDVRSRRRGHWRLIADNVAVLDGRFGVRARARGAGVHRIQATAGELGASSIVRVRVKR